MRDLADFQTEKFMRMKKHGDAITVMVFVGWLLWGAFCLALAGGAIAVAVHFVRKFW